MSWSSDAIAVRAPVALHLGEGELAQVRLSCSQRRRPRRWWHRLLPFLRPRLDTFAHAELVPAAKHPAFLLSARVEPTRVDGLPRTDQLGALVPFAPWLSVVDTARRLGADVHADRPPDEAEAPSTQTAGPYRSVGRRRAARPTLEVSLPDGARMRVGSSHHRLPAAVSGLAFAGDDLIASASSGGFRVWGVEGELDRYASCEVGRMAAAGGWIAWTTWSGIYARPIGGGEPRLVGEEGYDTYLCASASRLVACSARGRIRAWAMPGRVSLWEAAVDAPVLCLAMAADARWLALGTSAGRVIAVDAATGRVLDERPLSARAVVALAWSSRGARLAALCHDRLALLSVEHGRLREEAASEATGRVARRAIVWLSDDALAVGGDRQVHRVSTQALDSPVALLARERPRDEPPEHSGPTRDVEALAVSDDGARLALGGSDGSVFVHELSTGMTRPLEDGHLFRVQGLAMSKHRIASAGADDTIRLWCTDGSLVRCIAEIDRAAVACAWLCFRDEELLAVAGRELLICEAATGTVKRSLRLGGYCTGAALGDRFAAGLYGGGVEIWNLASGEHSTLDTGSPEHPKGIAWASGLVVVQTGRDARRWRDGEVTDSYPIQADHFAPFGLLRVPGSARLFAGNSKEIALIEGDRARVVATSALGIAYAPRAWAVHPAGKSAVIGTERGALHVVALPSLERRRTVESGLGDVYALAFSPDGATLLSGHSDGGILVWDGAQFGAGR